MSSNTMYYMVIMIKVRSYRGNNPFIETGGVERFRPVAIDGKILFHIHTHTVFIISRSPITNHPLFHVEQ